ncbi:MAG TPA: hypothetical protein VGX94_01945 [Terriglobia bacterium]|nr:hypothetical protein [Terriglobia bacterium]
MKKLWLCLFLPLLATPAVAKKRTPQATCETQFTIVREDALKNLTQGLSRKQAEWYEKKIQKKYPDVCYVDPAPDVPLVFFISETIAVYHGTQIMKTRSRSETTFNADTDVTGDVNADADTTGTATTTTTHSTPVRYSFDYRLFILTAETKEAPVAGKGVTASREGASTR